jgi:phage-related protein
MKGSMNGWDAEFVNEEAVVEFEALPLDIMAKLTRALDLLRTKGITALAMPLARHVEGKIWELRASGRAGIGRSLYVAATGRRVVILRTFIKKTQKTPRAEIEIARKRLGEVE